AGGGSRGFLGKGGKREEAEGSQPVVDGHDDSALFGERGAVRHGTGAGDIASTMNPEQDRVALIGNSRGSPDVEGEAILAHVVELDAVGAFEDGRLGAGGSEL